MALMGMKVLVVTRNASRATEVESILTPLATSLEVTAPRLDALSVGRSADLLVIDLSENAARGVQLLAELRACNPHVAILAICARFDLHSQLNAIENGANVVLSDPLERAEVIARVKILVRRRFGGPAGP